MWLSIRHPSQTKAAAVLFRTQRRPFIEAGIYRGQNYFSEEFTEVNLVLSLVPRPLMTAMIARLMPAAISPYSIAVAPVSSARNARMSLFMMEYCAGSIKSG